MPNNSFMNMKRAWKFIVLLGVVSLFADMTYEGARSVTGPFFAFLGASAAVTGLVAGLGEFIGYALRVVSGYLSDKSGRYWSITIWGYAINLLAVPLLAFAHRWDVAAVLVVLERFGKAIRTPARDTLLSHATAEVGRGRGFGLHEALDQIGGLTGPLIVAGVLYVKGGYNAGFAVLAVPAFMALSVLMAARLLYPMPRDFEKPRKVDLKTSRRFPNVYWLYMLFVGTTIAGCAHFQVISYHFKRTGLVSDAQIPILFAMAMGVDGLTALLIGKLYDRHGWMTLLGIPLFSIPITPLVFLGGVWPSVAGVVLWGAAMGIQETIMRAAIADIIPSQKRGLAYGLFNAFYGFAWLLGSTIMGFLYAKSIPALIFFSIGLEIISIPLLWRIRRAGEHTAPHVKG